MVFCVRDRGKVTKKELHSPGILVYTLRAVLSLVSRTEEALYGRTQETGWRKEIRREGERPEAEGQVRRKLPPLQPQAAIIHDQARGRFDARGTLELPPLWTGCGTVAEVDWDVARPFVRDRRKLVVGDELLIGVYKVRVVGIEPRNRTLYVVRTGWDSFLLQGALMLKELGASVVQRWLGMLAH